MPLEYAKRSPKQTVLYQAVSEALSGFISTCEESERPLPGFVKKEFGAYLKCGLLEEGFARVHCKNCNYDRLVAFSCKRRGFCPSCGGRFMAEKAAHLIDNVIPKVPMRQWILTMPPPLRYLLAYNSQICSKILSCFLKAIFSYQRHKAKKKFALKSVREALPAAITAVQRSGSALNLNLHFHSLIVDGIFMHDTDKKLVFRPLSTPTDKEITNIAWDTCQRTIKILEKNGLWVNEELVEDTLAQNEPALAELANASIKGTLVMGSNAGKRMMRFGGAAAIEDKCKTNHKSAYTFNIHARRCINANDRKGLERLCQYILRPPIANNRLSWVAKDTISLRLKRAFSDGTTQILFSPQELIAKLVPLIPAPRFNRLRYHGLFAPNAKYRQEIVPKQKTICSCIDADKSKVDDTPHNYGFAKLMARVFDIDVLECPKCKSRMQQIVFITEHEVIRKILKSVQRPDD